MAGKIVSNSYCLTHIGLARQARKSEDEAEQIMARFFQRFARIEPFRHEFWRYTRANKGEFRNIFGRRRYISRLFSPKRWERGRAERQAIGTLVQGTAAELTKESMVRIHKWLKAQGLPAHIVLTVHDEIQVDCRVEAMSEVTRGCLALMERYPEFEPIPIVCDGQYSTTHWGEKKPLPRD